MLNDNWMNEMVKKRTNSWSNDNLTVKCTGLSYREQMTLF